MGKAESRDWGVEIRRQAMSLRAAALVFWRRSNPLRGMLGEVMYG